MRFTRFLAPIIVMLGGGTAFAVPCPTGPVGATHAMQYVVAALTPTWASTASTYGISDLFTATGKCGNCHSAPSSASDRYQTCGDCHKGGTSNPYPDWLQFVDKTHLGMKAYYYPGITKGEAAVMRAKDGTMPPGAAPWSPTRYPAGVKVGWCDEIIVNYVNWIEAGMP